MSRYQLPVVTVGVLVLVYAGVVRLLGLPDWLRPPGWVLVALIVVVIVAMLLGFVRGDAPDPGGTVAPPVAGRWIALNSPSTKVPSDGARAYGQDYAIDLTYWPDGPFPDWGTGWARPESISGFGEPVLSMVDGTVVRASGWRRDHLARTSALAIAYFFVVEGLFRSIGGPWWVIGNHVVVRTDDGVFALVAHLRRGSVRVRTGDQVRIGQHLADCGNSGNSTVPHVHAHLMDRASAWTGRGLPLRFRGVTLSPPEPGSLPKGFPNMPDSTKIDRYEGIPVDGELMTFR